MHTNTTHVIFWNPSNLGLAWDPGYKAAISGFLANVAADSGRPSNVFSLTPQYTDGLGPAAYSSSFAGQIDDSDPAPAVDCVLPSTAPAWSACIKNTDLNTEVSGFIAANGLPTGMGDLYFLVTPEGLGSCIGAGPSNCSLGGSASGSFCGWHTHLSGTSTILLANIPYDAVPPHCESGNPRPNGSSADPALSTVAHEQVETVTDPLGNGWRDSSSQEVADLCATNFGPTIGGSAGTAYNEAIGSGHYYLQEMWSNADGACMPNELPVAAFSVSTSVPVEGSPVALDATASSDPDGSVVSYAWQLGDGASATGAAPTHTFATAGVYTVSLTVTDSDGYSATSSRRLSVDELPTASFSVSTALPGTRQPVSFNASGSRDPDGQLTAYSWSFGDGSTASGAAPTHAYARPGVYTASLTVIDGGRLTATTARTLRVVIASTISRVHIARSRGATFLVVTATGGGALTVAGRQVVLHAPGSHRFRLTAAQLGALRRHRLRMAVRFVPFSGSPVARTVTFSTRR